ncbi:MAG: class I SAM-dependent methyltransferase, partial [Bdellovibrionales bacterium]|nr:class I SAM-dependent methyltransferase [Oligoflexia bacterium]
MNYKIYPDDSVPLDQNSHFILDHLSRYQWSQQLVKGARVLDCACGKGYGSYLVSLCAKEVIRADLNDESLAIARTQFKRSNLTFEKVDVLKLTDTFALAEFDVVIAFEIIEHIPVETTALFLSQISKILKPGGVLLLSTPNHDVVTKSKVQVPDFHINNFKPTELRAALSPSFREVTLIGQFRLRSFFNHLLFSADFFNVRHWLRGLFPAKRASSELNLPVAAVKPIDSDFLDAFSKKDTGYRFTTRSWRQAGLTLALA